ncbi:MAG: radical SAM protein [Nitrososphaeria archaeon]|nr:radical SAM protein [Nitrososphaeria archaeon]
MIVLKIARLWSSINGLIECQICERRCKLKANDVGICKNYANISNVLVHIGYGVVSAVESRPIEIKPFFHYWPNSTSLTFSGYGCNFYCPWCQNHHISFSNLPISSKRVMPGELVDKAVKMRDEGLCASFNEPASIFDYLLDLFQLGKKHNLYGTIVTNGYFTSKAILELIEAGVDGFSIDIKGCPTSRRAIASIDHFKVFRNAKEIIDLGGHVEMVYLVVTDFNDHDGCVDWILGKHIDMLGPDVPLHINRYYPAHVWKTPPTSLTRLLEIKQKAERLGINYVYVGNVGIEGLEDTICPNCRKLLISRRRYRVTYFKLEDKRCPRCGQKIPIKGRYIKEKTYFF